MWPDIEEKTHSLFEDNHWIYQAKLPPVPTLKVQLQLSAPDLFKSAGGQLQEPVPLPPLPCTGAFFTVAF